MSKFIAFLKTTPLKPLWWKVKKWKPIKYVLGAERRLHKYWLLKIYYPQLYKKYAKEPVDKNKVLFMELRLPELTNSLRTLYKAVDEEKKYDIHEHFLRLSFVRRGEHEKRCREFIKDLATAGYLFVDEASNILGCLPVREETTVTQTWHGCGAFKKFGFSTVDKIFGGDLHEQLTYPTNKNYTHVTVSSPEVIWAYEEAMNLKDSPGIVKPLGISRTDVFYDSEFIAEAQEKLHKMFPASVGKKVILYAPTFRGRSSKAKPADKLDVPMFMKELGDEYVLVIKQHPLVKKLPEIPEECKEFAIDVTNSMQIDDLICAADICISDYSSLIFEYSLFERPMIFFAYDIDDYNDWRGFYYDYEEMTPGPIYTKNEELIDFIKHVDERFDLQQMQAFREKFMGSCDGHATERIMKITFGE